MSKTRYAIVGTGSRALMFLHAITHTHSSSSALVGVCDTNEGRRKAFLGELHGKVPDYPAEDFARMVREQRVDIIIVTTMDRTHHRYICAAMELGCDVITEKPLTVDIEKCREIYEVSRRTGRKVRVTFNYRYAPRNSKVKELLQQNVIGKVLSVHFEWLLDTQHGADYFRRWHRDKRNSGGLMVHKSTHHFDLVNWWLGTQPSVVMAMGGLKYYGAENAEQRGEARNYHRAHGNAEAKNDPFALHLEENESLKELYLDQEHHDGYFRDQSVFGSGISIEDDVGVLVQYASGAVMTYHLTAYSPWEGYRIAFNGTKGRLEYDVVEKAYISAAEGDHNFEKNILGSAKYTITEPCTLTLRPHWAEPISLPAPAESEGGHGGGDAVLLKDLFAPEGQDPLLRAAGLRDGALSILTGIAANDSLRSGQPTHVANLVRELGGLDA